MLQLSSDVVDTAGARLIKRMAQGDWFTNRLSACPLFASVYARTSPAVQDELRSLYVLLCRDETPMVRVYVCVRARVRARACVCVCVRVWCDVHRAARSSDRRRHLLVEHCCGVMVEIV
jgi:hypothetical protein